MIEGKPTPATPPKKFKFFSKSIAILTVGISCAAYYFVVHRPYSKRKYRAELEESAAKYWQFEGNRALLESSGKKE